MTKWSYDVVTTMMEMSHDDSWQDGGNKVGVFGGDDNI